MSGNDHDAGAPAGPGMAPTPTADPLPEEPVGPLREAPPQPQPQRRSVDDLARFIVAEAGRPIDVWAIAALLESFGIRDRDAVEQYGRRDVFGLAIAVQIRMPPAGAAGAAEEEPRPQWRRRLARFARVYGRGTFFFVPLALQLIALLTVGVSQFAALDFTPRQASIVAIAAALSFLVTAGFTQALGYISPTYMESGKHMLAESVSWAIIGLGAATAVVVAALLWVLAATTDAYPPEDLRTAAAYYSLLCAQGLTAALLYMLRRFLLMVATTVVSLVIAGLLYERTGLAIEHVHWIALAAGLLMQTLAGAAILKRRARETRGNLRLARLPRVRLLFGRALPVAAYGLLYFGLLIADRVLAWAAGENPLPLWFRAPYELGLAAALGGVVFALAFLEVTVEDFNRMLVPNAERFRVNAVREHNRAIRRFWARQLAFVGIVAAAGTWLVVVAAVALHELGWLGAVDSLYDDPVVRYVFGLGLVGYTLLALGIANSVFVMALARPWRAAAAMGAGLVVSVAAGTVATTHYAYWTAVFGMVAGAAVFAGLSSWQAWRTLRHVDYHSYAAW